MLIHLIYPPIHPKGKGATGKLVCRTSGLSDGQVGRRTSGMSEKWDVGQVGCWTSGLSDKWETQLSDKI